MADPFHTGGVVAAEKQPVAKDLESIEIMRLRDSAGWKVLLDKINERASRFKTALYRDDMSQKEFLVGKSVGYLSALEWVIREVQSAKPPTK